MSDQSRPTRHALREICVRFSIGEPISVAAAGGTRNLTFLVATEDGRWVLRRRHAGYCDPDRIAFDHSAARYLAERGVPVLPPRATPDGSTFFRVDGDIWEAYPFAEGLHLRDSDSSDATALARSLAEFHRAGSSFGARYEKIGPRGETEPDHLIRSIERVRSESPDAGEALDAYEDAVREAAARLETGAYLALPHTLVHGDVQPANIIMGEGGVVAFLDLDWLAWRPRIYDLCFALLCCVSGHEYPIGEGDLWALTQSPRLDLGLADSFLAEYQRSSSPLTHAEEAVLGPQLMLTWCHIRVDNCLKVSPDQRRAFLERDLDESIKTARYGQ